MPGSTATAGAPLRPRGRLLAVVVGLALTAGACGGGGGDDRAGLDAEFRPTPGERDVQFAGASKLEMGATLAVPPGATGASPGVLIIPGPGATTRDGPIVARPADPLYKDLSLALTAAGMVTLRYDHRGIGESQLETGQQMSWDDMVADAKEALAFLSQRREVDASRIAVIGHDMGGVIAMKLAAGDPRVKGVGLVSTPGRPLVDVGAEAYRYTHGPVSAGAYRTMIEGLLATGSLPPREEVRPEFQTSLPPNQDAFHRGMFAADPLADAAAVKVPVLLITGERSITVTPADTELLRQRLGGKTEAMVAVNSSASLQQVLKPVIRPFDPLDMDSHGLGPPVAEAPRDPASMDRIAVFLAAAVGTRPA